MNSEENIFESAATLPESERAAFLDSACAGAPEMRARLEALLRSHEVTSFMEDPTIMSPGFPAEQAGEKIGRYRLLQKIGEGGFGVVWMAAQMEPVTRRVALKIIKAGMDTEEVIARFEAERQALAIMDHPNISRVFDAGATAKGRPFFVMELVKGIPITRFCDEQQFTTRQRLELFADVCSAINHAHQKGVIHRDIKPTNVMVTVLGDKPVPKVIDFGIAKATQGRLTDRTLFTRFEQFIGTPAYMSPEQAVISGMDVDTRSDIYSLGVLLYELLTGRPPFDTKSLLSAGYEEMRRIIREVEPPRPSTRLKQRTVAGAESSSVKRTPLLGPKVKIEADLDWIVMKSIEKDRRRRYETANGLALDIRRFLTNQPVSATPPGAGYRLRKFVRRNRLIFTAAAAVAVAMISGLGIATVYYFKERSARTSETLQREIAERRTGEARASASEAALSELKARNFLYGADVNNVPQALRFNMGRARLLLDRHRPSPGELDLRGWEWRYLWEECRSRAQAILTKREGIPVFSASISVDGTLLLTGYFDGMVELWDIPKRKLLKVVQTEMNQRAHVAFSPAGESFAATIGERGRVKSIQIKTGAEVTVCRTNAEVRDLSFSRDGAWLAVLTHAPDAVEVRRASDGLPVMSYALPGGGGIFLNNARISPDKKRLYVSCGAFDDPLLRCVSIPDANLLWELPEGLIEDGEATGRRDTGFTAMDLSPDGRTLVVATGFSDSRFYVIEADTGKLLKRPAGHADYVLQVAFSRDGRFLASTSKDQTLQLWNTTTWTRLASPLRGHNHEVNAVAISHDGKMLASGNKDGEVLLWDPQLLRPPGGKRFLPSRIQNVTALPVKRMVLGQDTHGQWSLIDLWTLTEAPLTDAEALILTPRTRPRLLDGRLDRNQLGLSGLLNAPVLSPDGKILAVTSDSGQVGLYQVPGFAKIDILRTSMGAVFGAAFSPDSRRLGLGGGGETGVVLLDVATRQELLTLPSADQLLFAVQFADEGNTLLAASRQLGRNSKGSWQFWHVPDWSEIEDAERTGGRWPQTESLQVPAPPPTVAETIALLKTRHRDRASEVRAAFAADPANGDPSVWEARAGVLSEAAAFCMAVAGPEPSAGERDQDAALKAGTAPEVTALLEESLHAVSKAIDLSAALSGFSTSHRNQLLLWQVQSLEQLVAIYIARKSFSKVEPPLRELLATAKRPGFNPLVLDRFLDDTAEQLCRDAEYRLAELVFQELRDQVRDTQLPSIRRELALLTLIDRKDPQLPSLILTLLDDSVMRLPALKALPAATK